MAGDWSSDVHQPVFRGRGVDSSSGESSNRSRGSEESKDSNESWSGVLESKHEQPLSVIYPVDDSSDAFDNAFEACELHESSEYSTIAREDVLKYHDHIVARPLKEAREIVARAIEEHQDDPCLPHDKLRMLRTLVENTQQQKHSVCDDYNLRFEAFLINDWSIYSEVRTVTRPLDEEGEHYETFRVYFLGVLWACLGAAMDTFFSTRYPAISLDSGSILIMLVYSGKLFSKLPTVYVPWFGGRRFYINRPEAWSFKEQMLATLTMSVSVGSPYAMRAVVAQSNSHFLGIDEAKSFSYIFVLILSSNFMGFGIAGVLRTFLVYPTKCVWYNVLPTIAVNRNLVVQSPRQTSNGWILTGAEMFGLTMAASFLWFWVTNFLFTSLSSFDWPAWIAPQNVHLQAITGCINGLAFNPVNTFDWNNIGATSVIIPVFAQMMKMIGMLTSMVALIAIWYTNTSWTSHLPINTTLLFANDGKPFSVHKILDESSNAFDEHKYQSYSMPFWSAGALTKQGSEIMMYTGMIVYASLNYGKDMWASIKLFGKSLGSSLKRGEKGGSIKQFNDRFSRAQWKYEEVPEWWFLSCMVVSIGLAIFLVEYWTFTETPVWTIFFAIGLSLVFVVPFGYLYAQTSISVDINTLFEILIGLALPGNANALMISKVFASNFFSQSANYITNQVQGHYTGIAPRALFRAQTVSVLASVLVKSLLGYWVVSPSGIPDLCSPSNKDKFTCLEQRSFFNAAVQWGLIGPRRLLASVYPVLSWCFLFGAIFPLPFWLARRYIPRFTPKANWLLHSVHEMAILSGVHWAPKSLQYEVSLSYVNYAFNYYIRRRFPQWWQKYTYTFGHAMDVGVGYSGLIMFFSTQYKRVVNLNWWGNTQPFTTGDARGMTLKPIPDRGYFGPERGHFP